MSAQIYVDADACPVKDEVLRVQAGGMGVVVIFRAPICRGCGRRAIRWCRGA